MTGLKGLKRVESSLSSPGVRVEKVERSLDLNLSSRPSILGRQSRKGVREATIRTQSTRLGRAQPLPAPIRGPALPEPRETRFTGPIALELHRAAWNRKKPPANLAISADDQSVGRTLRTATRVA